jgi:nucleotide-binding universal stress UspA family protein
MRTKLGNVLVAVDTSHFQSAVIERVARLPVTPGAVVTLLHVVAPGPAVDEETEVPAARRALEEARSRLVAVPGAPGTVLTSVAVGTPFVEIVQRARHERDELVVVGRHGHRGFADALIGSTAERVVRKASVPVLVVGAPAVGPYRRVLVAVDLSETAHAAAELALHMLGADAQVRFVYAHDGRAREVGEPIAAFLGNLPLDGIPWDVATRIGDARAVILAEAKAFGADLLVMGTHGRSKIAQQLLGSVAEAVVRAAPCDVVLSRAKGHEYKAP